MNTLEEVLGVEVKDLGTKVLKLVDVNEATQQIQEAIRGCIPERMTPQTDTPLLGNERVVYNFAITLIEANLKEKGLS